MENGNGHIALQIESPPVVEKQRTKNTPKYSYNECMKNHALAINGNARDGCGEFMAGGEEGTVKALNCAACNCHRSFHRKQIEEDDVDEMEFPQQNVGYSTYMQMIEPSFRAGVMRTKRPRTKFTKEQKEKMGDFAVNAGWKLQKMEYSAVQQFCQEIGINRKVLKVWMQNNKHIHMGINKNNSSSSSQI